MKRLSLYLLTVLVITSTAFIPAADQILYPELAQSFKQLKKGISSISYERQEKLTEIQQVGIIAKHQKRAVVFEFLGTDGFSAPFASAILQAALANQGITDIKCALSANIDTGKVNTALLKMGFKADANGGLKYSEKAPAILFNSMPSNPQSVHILLNDGAAASLSAPDKMAAKLNYPAVSGSPDEKQIKLIVTEMMFVAMKIKDNWDY